MRLATTRWALAIILLAGCGTGGSRARETSPSGTSGAEVVRSDEVGAPATSEGDAVETGAGGDGASTGLAEDFDRSVEAVPAEAPVAATPDMPLSVESTSTSSGSSTTYELPPNMGYAAMREPSLLALVGYTPVPGVPARVLVATLELPPGQRFVPPVSSCQDVLLYVASGTLAASGTGIASVDAPATLYTGDAVRFGPEGDGLVVNDGSEPVRTLVAIARSEDGGPARIAVDERGDRVLCPSTSGSDPLSRPQRVASFGTSAPLVVSEGALEVRILLDADASGADHAGLAVLTGEPSFAVPEHVHDGAAEVLYFEDGSGTMHVGDHDVEIGAGVTVYVPEGVTHSFEPSGTRPLRALQFYAPSGPEQRFRAMASGG